MKMKDLYFAPINKYGNYIYRHLLLKNDADYVFSEMIVVKDLDMESNLDKIKTIESDVPYTIFQIACSSCDEIDKGISYVCSHIKKPLEINLNMGCPSSGMRKQKLCGGILFDLEQMQELCNYLFKKCNEKNIISSVKIRIGNSPEKIEIEKYMKIISSSGIKKVYIHARTLGEPYKTPAHHEDLVGLKEKFNDMKIIINGDIFSLENYQKVSSLVKNDGVMIGRAAIYNPLIFKQIKTGINSRKGSNNPVHLDPGLIPIADKIVFSNEKKKIISDLISIAKKHEMKHDLFRQNMMMMLKGASGHLKINKELNKENELDRMILIVKNFIDKNFIDKNVINKN